MSETVPVRWSKEPEKREWMLEHAGESPIAEVCAGFEERFGHPLKKSQVSLFRAEYGIGLRRGNRAAHRRDAAPVGAERVVKGYVMVKVREFADKPQSKDNWRFKHVLAWEEASGRALPDGWMVLFADHDVRNFDPDNLVAVPRRIIGVMNAGPEWYERESCEAAAALAWLKVAENDAAQSCCKCSRCGAEFKFERAGGTGSRMPRLCPACKEGFMAEHGRSR